MAEGVTEACKTMEQDLTSACVSGTDEDLVNIRVWALA